MEEGLGPRFRPPPSKIENPGEDQVYQQGYSIPKDLGILGCHKSMLETLELQGHVLDAQTWVVF